MQVSEVMYEIQKRLGEYEHEKIVAKVIQNSGKVSDGFAMMKLAKEIACGAVSLPANLPRPQVTRTALPAPQRQAPPPQRTQGSGYGQGAGRKEYAPTDWTQFPIHVNTSQLGKLSGPDFNASRDFLKASGFKWNKDAKIWQGTQWPQFTSSVSFLESVTTDVNANGYEQDQVPTAGWPD